MNERLNAIEVRRFLDRNFKTREWLAVQLGVSGSLVNQMLAGRVPKVRTLNILAQLMGVRIETLVRPNQAKESA